MFRPRNSIYAHIFPWSTHIVLLIRRGRLFIQTTFEQSKVRHTANKYVQSRATIGPPAKRHQNSVSLAGRWWSSIICILGIFRICVSLMFKRACQYVQCRLVLSLCTETLCLSILLFVYELLCTKLKATGPSFLHAPSEVTNRTGLVSSLL